MTHDCWKINGTKKTLPWSRSICEHLSSSESQTKQWTPARLCMQIRRWEGEFAFSSAPRRQGLAIPLGRQRTFPAGRVWVLKSRCQIVGLRGWIHNSTNLATVVRLCLPMPQTAWLRKKEKGRKSKFVCVWEGLVNDGESCRGSEW